MIVLDLCCDKAHRFEGWFGSADAFEEQLERGLVECPACGSRAVRRLPSAPYVQTRSASLPASSSAAPEPAGAIAASKSPDAMPATQEAAAAVMAMLRKIAREAEDVGERLPDEARRMHYGDSEARSIRGSASRDEVVELLEEGILLMPVPPGEEDLH